MKIKKWLILCCIILGTVALQNAPDALADTQEVTIYDMFSPYGKYVTQPASYPVSYQIPESGSGVSYKVISGDQYVRVSAGGLVTARRTYRKKQNGYYVSVPEGEDYDYYEFDDGDAVIRVTTENGEYLLNVHLLDYGDVYVDQVMDQYIAENITEDMSDYEVARTIGKFAARYEYSTRYSSVKDMVIYGSGDCWASTDAVISLAQRMNYDGWFRNAEKESGIGGNHKDAMLEINGSYFELDAGYMEEKGEDGYRPFVCRERTSLYSSYCTGDGRGLIYQYDGKDKTGTLTVPETIDGYPINIIDKSAFAGTDFEKIILPEGVDTIRDAAFRGCDELKEIKLPKSVSSIGQRVFSFCGEISNFSIDEDNPYFYDKDNVIYTKDGETLLEAAGEIKGKVTVEPTVKKIAEYAFYFNSLTGITLPSSIEEFENGCFGDCKYLTNINLPEGLKIIGSNSFYNDNLSVIRIPASVTEIGAAAFRNNTKLKKVYFYGDAPSFGSVVNEKFCDLVFDGCSDLEVYYPENNLTWEDVAGTDHGGENVTWKTWKAGTLTSIENADVKLTPDTYIHTGTFVEPQEITVSMAGKKLVEGTDYAVIYPYGPGTVGKTLIQIIGMGEYEGVKDVYYTIEKAEQKCKLYIMNTKLCVGQTAWGIYSYDPGVTYSSSDPAVVSIDEEGYVTGVSEGTAIVTAMKPGDDGYKEWRRDVEITVKKSLNDYVPVIPDATAQPETTLPPQVTATPEATKNPNGSGTLNWRYWPAATRKEKNSLEDSGIVDEFVKESIGKNVLYKNGKYRITGIGKATFIGIVKKQKTVRIPDRISYGGYQYKVTEIAPKACAGDKKIVKVIIGKNVSKIGAKAFWKCRKLKKVICRNPKIKKKNIGKQAFKPYKFKK